MGIPYQNLQTARSTPTSWALLVLVFGFIITYPVFDYVLLSHVKNQMLERQYNSQLIAASALRALIAKGLEHGATPIEAFNAADQAIGLGQLTGVGTALIAPDGTVAAFNAGFQLAGVDSLSTFKVRVWPSGVEIGFMEFATGPPSRGKLMRPTGADTGAMISASTLATSGWHIIATQGTDSIVPQLATTRLYLLVTFLVLAVFLVLLILSFYFTLAAGLTSAINSARVLEDASVRFQEQAGALRRPLHNIQGLADMLLITEDPDERANYIKEIKGEVKLVIEDLEKTSS